MKITVESRPAGAARVDVLGLPLFQFDPAKWKLPARLVSLDRALDGQLSRAVQSGDLRGKPGQTLTLYPDSEVAAGRIVLMGLGEEAKLDAEALRCLAGRLVGLARDRRLGRAGLLLPASRRVRPRQLGQALAEGAVLANYRFDRYRSKAEAAPIESVSLLVDGTSNLRALRNGVGTGTVLAESQNLARDLSNESPSVLPPAALAREAQKVAREVGLRSRVLSVPEMKKRGMGAILAVGQGSANPPRLIVLEHNAPPRSKQKAGRQKPTICLVGKGITFDSGGLSLKPAASMVTMKHDMSGGAAVIGAMRAVALLRLPLHVVGVIGSAENMPSGTAYRPDDIVKTLSGQTVEIGNTDAEGRLVLADALYFAKTEFEPDAMIDIATLTGACSVALGNWASAVLGSHDRLVDSLRRVGQTSGERVWQLPLWDEHREHMRGRIGDLKQTGGRAGGTITAAAFLSFFAEGTPWAHLDIAPTANVERAGPYQPFGATGVGVRLLTELLRGWRDLRPV